MPSEIRIAAVDDHPMFIEGLRRALRAYPNIALVATGGSAADALRIVRENSPDVLLLDLVLPGSGLHAARKIAEQSPGVGVLVLTGSDDELSVSAAFEAGAKGFVTKGATIAELAEAITSIKAGRPYVTQSIASRLIVQKLTKSPAPSPDDLERLNYRETQVLERAARGMTNQDIAEELSLHVRTIKNYMSRILQKLNVRNRATAVARFTRSM